MVPVYRAGPAPRCSLLVLIPTYTNYTALLYTAPRATGEQAGLGGAIYIEHTALPEPQSLPGGDPAFTLVPHALLVWDSGGARRYLWHADAAHGAELRPAGSVNLPALSRATVENVTFAAWRAAYDAAMLGAPLPRNASADGSAAVNGSNVSFVNASATNFTALYEEFVATLPRLSAVGDQPVASVSLEPRTASLYWSTGRGHLLRASLGTSPNLTAEDAVPLLVANESEAVVVRGIVASAGP